MKHKKLYFGLVIQIIVTVTISAVFVITSQNKISTSQQTRSVSEYEDNRGYIYDCSQPIIVKQSSDSNDINRSGQRLFLPVDQAKANKYCQSNGVE